MPSVSSATGICPGDGVTFTCQTRTSAFTWTVTPVEGGTTTCVALRTPVPSVTDPTCGPNGEFSLSISGDGSTSTLSTQSVDENLNETRIQCLDGDVDQTICILGETLRNNHTTILPHSVAQMLPHCLNSNQPSSQREMWEEKSVW